MFNSSALQAYLLGLLTAILLSAGLGFTVGYHWSNSGWQKKDAKRIQQEKEINDALIVDARKADAVAAKEVYDRDAAFQQQEIAYAQKIEDLQRALRNSTTRLSVKSTKPPALGTYDSTAACIPHVEARCELDPEDAERLIRIAADGDEAIRQLTALQEFQYKNSPSELP